MHMYILLPTDESPPRQHFLLQATDVETLVFVYTLHRCACITCKVPLITLSTCRVWHRVIFAAKARHAISLVLLGKPEVAQIMHVWPALRGTEHSNGHSRRLRHTKVCPLS